MQLCDIVDGLRAEVAKRDAVVEAARVARENINRDRYPTVWRLLNEALSALDAPAQAEPTPVLADRAREIVTGDTVRVLVGTRCGELHRVGDVTDSHCVLSSLGPRSFWRRDEIELVDPAPTEPREPE